MLSEKSSFLKRRYLIKLLSQGTETSVHRCRKKTVWIRVSTSFFSGINPLVK